MAEGDNTVTVGSAARESRGNFIDILYYLIHLNREKNSDVRKIISCPTGVKIITSPPRSSQQYWLLFLFEATPPTFCICSFKFTRSTTFLRVIWSGRCLRYCKNQANSTAAVCGIGQIEQIQHSSIVESAPQEKLFSDQGVVRNPCPKHTNYK